jgi:hypothetical protein
MSAEPVQAEIVQEDVQDAQTALTLIDQQPENPYAGMAMVAFTAKQSSILLRPLDKAKEVKLRPDGLIYFPEMYYRRRLNEAFGPGAWALPIVRIGQDGQTVAVHCRLYAEGRFIAEAVGEADFIPNNSSYTYATAVESAKSNGLMRCCKDIGIASELWDPDFIKEWKAEYAIGVWCSNEKGGKKKKLWRLKSDPPIDQWPWKEDGNSSQQQQRPAQQTSEVGAVINLDQRQKLTDTAKDKGIPTTEAIKILERFGFKKTAEITTAKFSEVLTAFGNWIPPASESQMDVAALWVNLQQAGDKRFNSKMKQLAHLIDWMVKRGDDVSGVTSLNDVSEETKADYAKLLADLYAESK